MMRILLAGFICFFCLSSVIGQTLEPCGTTSQRSEWLKNFQKDGIDLSSQRPIEFRIQLNAHQVGDDQGALFNYGTMLEALAGLERDYDSTGLGFVVNLPFDTLNSTEYNAHDDVLTGADMMFANNKPDALNIYFLSNPAGNCGYNLPYAGIAMASQCSRFSDKTISHEVGHALSLPHTFLGWEGGQTDDGSTPANFGAPAPTTVTYDYTFFQSTLVRDTLIIDTALVEMVARTNCTEAADGFCDTPADYIASRWNCAPNGRSAQQQLDPDGVAFNTDGSFIMSYSDDDCQSRFSEEQKAAMQAFAQAERPTWVRMTFDTNLVRGVTSLELDTDGFALSPDELTFTAVENATHYFVQVSATRGFTNLLIDTVVTSPSVPLPASDFVANETYNTRIYAFNDHSFRAGSTRRLEFIVPEGFSNTKSVNVTKISVAPNPVVAGATLAIPVRKDITRISWYDARGRLVKQESPSYIDQVGVPAELTSGVYNLMLLGQDGNRYSARIQVIR